MGSSGYDLLNRENSEQTKVFSFFFFSSKISMCEAELQTV